MSVPSLREQLMVSYLEGHDPDVDDLHEIVSLSEDEIDALFRIFNAVSTHDGCVDSDDAVRLSLGLFKGCNNSQPLRAVDPLTTVSDAPIPMTDRCVICQCDMEDNGHQSQLTKGGKTLQHSYCMDCWDDVSQIVRGAESDEEEPMFFETPCFHQSEDEEEDADHTITCTGCGGERIINDEVILSAAPENGLCAEELDECPSTTDLLQEALEESLQPDAIEAVGDRRRFNGRPKGIIEEQPRAECRSSCCGTLGARMREGSCRGCRGLSAAGIREVREMNGWSAEE